MGGLNSRMEWIEERITELEDRRQNTMYQKIAAQSEQKRKSRMGKKKEQRLEDPWDNNKRSDFCIIRVSKGRKKEGGAKKCSYN